MAEKKKHAGHGHKKVSIEHHKDRSHSIHYQHEDGPEHDVRHAVSNIDGVHDSLEQHLGQPNVGEGQMAGMAAPQMMPGTPGV